MKCAEYQDLIVTGYVDNELTRSQRASVDGHLATCSACREFKEEVLKAGVQPFTGLPQAAVPEHVWTEIKGRLEQSRQTENIKPWWHLFRFPQAALFAVPAAALLLAVLLIPARTPGIVSDPQIVETASAEQNEENYFSYLYGNEEQDTAAGAGFGTSAEVLMSL